MKWETELVYLYDVIVYSETVAEHIAHLQQVLRFIQSAGLSLKISKSPFLDISVNYMGHAIGLGRLEVEWRDVVEIERAKPVVQ